MDTDRLRWFVALADAGRLRTAARELRVTPGALSKAISDLEARLSQRLFVRAPTGVVLTDAGHYLRRRAAELLDVEDEIRSELQGGKAGPRRVALLGTEPLLALHLAHVLRLVHARFPEIAVELRPTRDDDETKRTLEKDASCLAVVAGASPARAGPALPTAKFGTFVGRAHPLAARGTRRAIPIADVIARPFVVPERAIFGTMAEGVAADGWRDDVFPRKKRLVAPTLALVRAYVASGHAVAYLPLALGAEMDAEKLTISGCPYDCEVSARLVRARAAPGWLRQIS